MEKASDRKPSQNLTEASNKTQAVARKGSDLKKRPAPERGYSPKRQRTLGNPLVLEGESLFARYTASLLWSQECNNRHASQAMATRRTQLPTSFFPLAPFVTRYIKCQTGRGINEKNNSGQTPLIEAIVNRDEATLAVLLMALPAGGDLALDINATDRNGRSALWWAASYQNWCLWLLLTNGANVNQVDNHSITPLVQAIQSDHEKAAKALVDFGANVNHKCRDGTTPLLLAIKSGNDELAIFLLRHGADIKQAQNHGHTLFKRVIRCGLYASVKLLLEKGIDVAHHEKCGQTPLIVASLESRSEIARLLMEHGANVNQTDNFGYTPLLATVLKGHHCIVNLLIQHGANVNQVHVVDNCTQTPLIQASRMGHYEIVKLLVQHGANVNQADHLGHTPLASAILRGHYTIAQYLISSGAKVHLMQFCFRKFIGLALSMQKSSDAAERLRSLCERVRQEEDHDEIADLLRTCVVDTSVLHSRMVDASTTLDTTKRKRKSLSVSPRRVVPKLRQSLDLHSQSKLSRLKRKFYTLHYKHYASSSPLRSNDKKHDKNHSCVVSEQKMDTSC